MACRVSSNSKCYLEALREGAIVQTETTSVVIQGTGRWITSLLPQRAGVLYCEPFAGMLGVLLQRPPSKSEEGVSAWT